MKIINQLVLHLDPTRADVQQNATLLHLREVRVDNTRIPAIFRIGQVWVNNNTGVRAHILELLFVSLPNLGYQQVLVVARYGDRDGSIAMCDITIWLDDIMDGVCKEVFG